ncbi:unnamed protein product [Prunus armeniaca]
MRKHAKEEKKWEAHNNQVILVVGMLDQSSEHHSGSQSGHGLNGRRHSQGQYRMQPHLFSKIIHDVCNYDSYLVQKYDVVGVSSLLLEQKLTTSLRMLTYGTFADQVDEIARIGKSTILECLVKFCDTIETLYMRDYLCKPTPRDFQRLMQKAKWKNCPTACKEIMRIGRAKKYHSRGRCII